jgi:hypothetical protein
LEKDILQAIVRRNRILDELIQVNHLAITEYENLCPDDWKHFLITRKFLIESLSAMEDQIIILSMYDWSTFNFDQDYKQEYISLNDNKDEKVYMILEQDKALESLSQKRVSEINVA